MMGLLIGGGFFILKLDDYFKALNFYKNLSKISYENQQKKEQSEEIEKLQPKKYKSQGQRKNKDLVPSKDSATSEKINIASSKEEGNDLNDNKDSLRCDTCITIPESGTKSDLGKVDNNEDIVVKKDELLSVKNMEVINVNAIANSTRSRDSIIQQASGIRDDNNIKYSYTVEFWASPINYKGYKMAKNKIVLYGINPAEGSKIYKLNDNFYLKNLVGVYKLDFSGDFRQFEKISDEALLVKLK